MSTTRQHVGTSIVLILTIGSAVAADSGSQSNRLWQRTNSPDFQLLLEYNRSIGAKTKNCNITAKVVAANFANQRRTGGITTDGLKVQNQAQYACMTEMHETFDELQRRMLSAPYASMKCEGFRAALRRHADFWYKNTGAGSGTFALPDTTETELERDFRQFQHSNKRHIDSITLCS